MDSDGLYQSDGKPEMFCLYVATVFFTPSGKNTKTQIKLFGYRFR